MELVTDKDQRKILNDRIKEELIKKTGYIKRKANGQLNHDYLVPGGFYSQQWDWDAFFMGIALSNWIPSEAVYLKNLSLNILEHTTEEGFCPGCLTEDGPSKTLKQAKPFTAQGIYIAGEKLGDYEWVRKYLYKLEQLVMYREKQSWHKEYNLGSWYDAMESGADNNPAMLDYEHNTVLAPDLNTFLAMEYMAFSKIVYALGDVEKSEFFKDKAENLVKSINEILWCKEDSCYYTYNTLSKSFIKCVSYSSLIPLWAGIAEYEDGKKLIDKYVLNPDVLLSDYGIRTLSKQDVKYNNENIIVPYSNWQGPVWPIANYLHCLGLMLYGYKVEASKIAGQVINLCLKDIESSGGMHENYHAETGASLAADDFVSWNVLYLNILDQLELGDHPAKDILFHNYFEKSCK